MITILKWNDNFKRFTIAQFLEELRDEIEMSDIEELQLEQFRKGEDKENRTIGVYSKATELIAKKSNPRKPKIAGRPYNLEWSGDFFNKTKLVANNTGTNLVFYLDSKSNNKNKLFRTIKRFGLISNPETSLFGFQTKNKDEFTKFVKKEYLTNFKKYL